MIIKIVILSTLVAAVVGQDCGGNWKKFKDNCYLVSSSRLSWSEAGKSCHTEDADLVIVSSTDIDNFLDGWLSVTLQHYWLGLHDVSLEGNFKWVDGETPADKGYVNWAPGEPNNAGTGEDCVEVRYNDGDQSGQWNDMDCTNPQYYICERSINTALKCDHVNGWKTFADKCYYWQSSGRTWEDAELYCNRLNGNLVSVNSAEEQAFLAGLQAIYGQTYWIGLTDKYSSSAGVYTWSDGSSPTDYVNWYPNEPNNNYFDDGGDCTRVRIADSGQWSVIKCTDSKPYVCERDQGTCPQGWKMYLGHCYQINANNPKTWTDAKHYCDAQGAYMVTVLTDGENQFITSQFEDLRNIGVTDLYIGISDVASDGDFKWTQGSAVSYTNWNTGMPKDTVGQDDCGSMYTGDLAGRWDTKGCYLLQAFICKIQVGRMITPIPPDQNTGRCEPEWHLFGDSCFYFSNVRTTWQEGEDLCVGMKAQLPSIHSAEDQSFLTSRMDITKIATWIGLNDQATEGTFVWNDGTPVDFTNWMPGQPSADGDCGRMKSTYEVMGMWRDAACTGDFFYACKKPKIDDGTPVTPSVSPSAIHDLHCGEGWEYNVDSGLCYKFQLINYKPWIESRSQCRMEGGDLVSVGGFDEENYILDHVGGSIQGKAWIGGSDLSAEGGWEWSDGAPFRYVNWNAGEPNNAGDEGEHCAEIIFSNGKWNDYDCNSQMGYICKRSPYLSKNFFVYALFKLDGYDKLILSDLWPQDCAKQCVMMTSFTCRSFDYDRINRVCYLSEVNKDNIGLIPTLDTYPFDYYERDMSVTTAPPPTPLPSTFGCSGDWRPYNGFCFKHMDFYEEFAEAQTRCRDQGAELTSIRDANENSFIAAYTNEASPFYKRVWTGLNDINQEMYYEWSDGTEVTYTLWYYYEPNNAGDEDCVEMYMEGRWNDIPCTGYSYPSMCKKPMTDLGTLPPTDEGCPEGWVGYLSSCYRLESGIQASWDGAQTLCEGLGGHLAVINDLYEQFYLNSQLGIDQSGINYWVGLYRRDDGTYKWIDDSFVFFDNWGEGQPDSSTGNCVMANSGLPAAGYWFNAACNSFMPYVCEKLRYGFTTTQAPAPVPTTRPSNVGCGAGWIGFGGNCFQVNEIVDSTQRLTWFDARSACVMLGGDLASFHGPGEEGYIIETYVPLDPFNSYGYWIGLHDQAVEGGYEWSDGSPVDYTNWEPGEPNDSGGSEECVEGFMNAGRGWNDNSCYATRHYICKIPKGQAPRTPAPSPTPGTICPSDPEWTYRHPYCYWNSEPTDFGRKGFTEAEDYCHEKGGHLASIHDADEQKFINDMLRYYLVTEYWIGLRETSMSGQYGWTDGTVLDYTNWADGQPDDNNGMEQCAEHYVDRIRGKWKDLNCGIPQAFVCKKVHDNTQPVTHEPTTPPQGGCPDTWLKLDDRCYHVEGISDAQKETWQGARDKCGQVAPGGILATIHSQRTQSELTALLRSVNSDVWIGLSDLGAESKFHWVDGTTMDYTNWGWGQPDGNILLPDGSKSDCAKMINEMDEPGKWNDVACDSFNSYLCQTMPDPSLPVIPPDSGTCINDGYFDYFGTCYRVYPILRSFSEAKTMCENDGTVLATITDGFQEAFLETQLFKNGEESLWIGLLNDQTTGVFKWLDGWPLWYTNWGENEPSLGDGEACVIVTSDGVWDNVPCNEQHYPVCYSPAGPKPTTHAPGEGTCLDGWLTYGDWCYKFDLERDFASWPEANDDCQRAHGAQLASIHSKQEMEFIRQNAQGVIGVRAIWLGMRRGFEGEFQNEDGTPVDYVNWANGEPNGVGQDGNPQDCVEFTDDAYGKWYDDDCYRGAAYLCKINKMIPFTPTTPVPTIAPCPTDPNWLYMHPYCYFVSGAIGSPVRTWTDANNYCMSQGGYLASIHSSTEQKFINSIVRRAVPNYWIGFRETSGTKEYRWSDGTDVDYVNWNPGEPNDWDGQEACAEIEVFDDGRWNDMACGIQQGFICKRQHDNTIPITKPQTTPAEGGCPPDWYKMGARCYQTHGVPGSGRLNWEDARTSCQQYPNGELASIHYQGVQALITSLMKNSPGLNVWIGLSDRGSFGKFHWTDESTLDYTNWAAGQPDGIVTRPQDIDCVEMTNDPDHPGKWDDVDCALQRAYLCQRPLDASYGPNPTFSTDCTRPGYQSYFGSCFRLDTEPRVYEDAKTMCRAENANLATINDGYDEAFVETVMLNNGFSNVWIGLQQDPNTEEFKWVDGWPLLWTNWGPREPSQVPGEGCVTITSDGDWDNSNCNIKQVSMCKYTIGAVKPTTPAPVEGYCPESWQPYGASCYKFDVRHDRASWIEAQYDCQQSGANLASVHTKAENEFIRAYANLAIGVTSVWLGLSLNSGGDFEWKDGTPVDYTNWANNEPDGDDIDNGCVDMYPDQYGKWEDSDCQSNGAYVCMLPKVPGEPPTTTSGPRPTLPPEGTTPLAPPITPEPRTDRLSPGAIVGIVFAVLALALIVGLVVFYDYRKNKYPPLEDDEIGKTGFENILYNPSQEGVSMETKAGESDPGAAEA